MKYVDEYRDPHAVHRLARAIAGAVTRPWTLMEVCGGQTHAIVRYGLDELLPPQVTLVHGPGCPVCVTPVEVLDQVIAIARRPGVILCTFGDMLRVPGSRTDLAAARAEGADVRIVYSPLDALDVARRHTDRDVVFLAVGFETTAPAVAMAVYRAHVEDVANFSVLVSHVLVPPAMEAILAAPDRRIDGFLAAGHVCTVMGVTAYEPLARRHHVPIVVTGFEPRDILEGVLLCVRQLESGRAEVENQYARVVRRDGNPPARRMIDEVFRVVDRKWRGLGAIAGSGLALRRELLRFDAARRFGVHALVREEDGECRAGEVLTGLRRPRDCPAFGTRCTPETPLGAPMVSSEGACAAWYRYRR
jgi:hydrogenase expression/formation protein HypD